MDVLLMNGILLKSYSKQVTLPLLCDISSVSFSFSFFHVFEEFKPILNQLLIVGVLRKGFTIIAPQHFINVVNLDILV